MTIRVTHFLPPRHASFIDAGFEARFPGMSFHATKTVEELAAAMPGSEILLAGNPQYSPEVAKAVRDGADALKWIQFSSVGTDTAAANGLPPGVTITNASGVRTAVLSAHAIALMLGVMRRFHHSMDQFRRRHWSRDEVSPLTVAPQGKTMVIVGVGEIGRDTARKAKVFGMKTIGVSRAAKTGDGIDEVVPRNRLHDVLPRADVLLLSAPLDAETQHMIGAAELALLKPKAFLVNIARGALIDEPALIAALKARTFAGAAIDVTEVEPIPPDSPLFDLDNLLISPHIGAHSDLDLTQQLADLIAGNLARYQAGEPLHNVVA